MRKKVQYFIAFSNLILQIIAFTLYRSVPEMLFFRFEHPLLTKILAAFIVLMPVIYVLMGNLVERNVKNAGVYSYKVFPIIFIILLFSSWIVCVYVNAALGPFIIENQNWFMLVLGSAVMYLANYVTMLNKDNPVFRKLGIRIKNEYVFKTTLKIALYGIGFEGYLIILFGALGFFYNRLLSLTLVLLSIVGSMIAIVAAYFVYTRSISKRKIKSSKSKGKHRD